METYPTASTSSAQPINMPTALAAPISSIDPFSSPPQRPSSAKVAPYTPAELAAINASLQGSSPQEILRWAIHNLPRLYQTTAFGLTGTVALDMIHKIAQEEAAQVGKAAEQVQHPIDLIFIDTLYHFTETLDLATRASEKYGAKLHIYLPPAVNNRNQFEALYGKELWRTDEESYDYLVKVEPARRAYQELDVRAVITGRRKSQGGSRSTLLPLEIDETGLIKVNPLCDWSFGDVKSYVDAHGVPYNVLLDQGYKSVGDWHSTARPDGTKVAEDAGERAGRWAGRNKDECGLHQDYFKMKKAFAKRQRERELQRADMEREKNEVIGESTTDKLGQLAL